tara:strand:+ start:2767 stop:3126 length:360 start_codon:yes stop_codon:yes gene_type:complete
MTNEQKPNVTEQMFRETSEHFMQELEKKDKIIKFLKQRLQDVEYQKGYIEKLRDRFKYALFVQKQLIDSHETNIYDLITELGSRTKCIEDNTRSVDGDIDDWLENYSDLVVEDIDINFT